MAFRQTVAKLCKRLRNSVLLPERRGNYLPNAGKLNMSSERELVVPTWSKRHGGAFRWAFLYGQAAIILGINSLTSLAEDVSIEANTNHDKSVADVNSSEKIEDGSVISNEHTSKWRVFTDNGRDYFMQGNIAQAEKFFLSALQEAKEGFGERDPHVASACNNLAELYRVKKEFGNAEPLYVEAINILENYFGTDDVRVGAALHNLGQFYLVQRKLEEARLCYERALKIKRRVLGESHSDYADTMYHLGTVLYLQGKELEGEDLILDSINILEAAGQGESLLCIRRMQHLAQMYTKSNQSANAEILLRKILHMVELSKGWKSLDTVIAAERLALALQTVGRWREAEELLERCLEARKSLLPDGHIQNAANMLHIARGKVLIANVLMKTKSSHAMAELDAAKNLLLTSIRVATQALRQSKEQKGDRRPYMVSGKTVKERQSAALILLQALNALGSLEVVKLEFLDSTKQECNATEADAAFRQCISTYKELGAEKAIYDNHGVKAEYLSCLRRLHDFMISSTTSETADAKQIKDEIQRVEAEMSEITKGSKIS